MKIVPLNLSALDLTRFIEYAECPLPAIDRSSGREPKCNQA